MTSEVIEKEITKLKEDVALLKHVLSEDGDLSERAKKALAKARKTPESEYTILE